MYSFKNDYSEGAHRSILEAFLETNLEQENGYGEDSFTEKAIELIRKQVNDKNTSIHFLSGGTQTNLIAISAFLRPHEAVISANTGHILVHETGAIEATGHKIISVYSNDGKLNIEKIEKVLKEHNDEHMVKPRLVYISNSTEIGTIYSKKEMETLYNYCKNNKLILYVDGARLGSALCSEENDLSLEDLNNFSDVFYIGGTKNGALFGEALIISNESLKEDFRYHIKQKGGLLAKGRALGLQFYKLFENNLYFDLASIANQRAKTLSTELKKMGFNFLVDSPSNQIFPILPNKLIKEIEKKYSFYIWERFDHNSSVIRLVTSWATSEEKVTEFIDEVKKLYKLKNVL